MIARLLATAPSLIAAHAKPQPRCVLATRVGIETLARFGIAAEPRVVVIEIYNRAVLDWHAAGCPEGVDGYLARGCWLMTNDPASRARLMRPLTHPFPAHLILTAAGRAIDLDVQQFTRPAYGITPPPALAFPWSEDGRGLRFAWGAMDYRPWPATHEAPPWRHSGDWTRDLATIIDPLVRAIRKNQKGST